MALTICSCTTAVGRHFKLLEANGCTPPPPSHVVSGLVKSIRFALIESQHVPVCWLVWFGKLVGAVGRNDSDLPTFQSERYRVGNLRALFLL